MIAHLAFTGGGRVRRAHFARRPEIPIDAACVVANGAREALRTILGEGCALTLGEPVALGAAAWRTVVRDGFAFAVPGRSTDLIFVLGRADARTLLRAAFGEEPGSDAAAWSALEAGAIERIVARCATGSDALCSERRGETRAVDPDDLPPCAAYFDLRITAPIVLTIGVGVVRELSATPPARTLAPAVLERVALPVRVVLARVVLPAPQLLALGVGDLIPLECQVGDRSELNVAGQTLAAGRCGVVQGRAAFELRALSTGENAP